MSRERKKLTLKTKSALNLNNIFGRIAWNIPNCYNVKRYSANKQSF